jgi:hypothetical protein
VLDLCDQVGFTVMGKAFDQWRRGKNGNDYGVLFDQRWEKDLADFIRRDRNHPSCRGRSWRSGRRDGVVAAAAGALRLQ